MVLFFFIDLKPPLVPSDSMYVMSCVSFDCSYVEHKHMQLSPHPGEESNQVQFLLATQSSGVCCKTREVEHPLA